MAETAFDDISQQLDELFRQESRRVYATLVRILGDLELAEEALHEAFAVAVQRWPAEGVPENPRAWLVSTGRHKAIDLIRRQAQLRALQPELLRRANEVRAANLEVSDREIEDDRLRLIFTCCHPAIDPQVQVPLTLREVCGLTTEEIASAFLVAPPTMAQRIVRGKAKIRAARIPFALPSLTDLPERLDAVLAVIYLVFNEGYAASSGASLVRSDLSAEAIRLARLVAKLCDDQELPDPEVNGLLALMLLHESRRMARTSAEGDIVLLEDQDRSLWDREMIAEGQLLVEESFAGGQVGGYTVQAAISAVHASAATADQTDWTQIVALYDLLLQAEPSPVIELNRAVAVAMREGPEAGLRLIDEILDRGNLADYHLAHSARGELLRRLGDISEAKMAFEQALRLAKQETERRFLTEKIRGLEES